MGNNRTEAKKRGKQRKKLREQLLTEQEVMKIVPIPGTEYVSGIEKCLDQKRVYEHLSDDNFSGEW
jgi:hypothetical protein